MVIGFEWRFCSSKKDGITYRNFVRFPRVKKEWVKRNCKMVVGENKVALCFHLSDFKYSLVYILSVYMKLLKTFITSLLTADFCINHQTGALSNVRKRELKHEGLSQSR